MLHAHETNYAAPATKDEMIAELSKENPSILDILFRQVQLGSLATSSAKEPQAPASSSSNVKLPHFYEKDPTVWFEQIEVILDGSLDAVKKGSLVRALPTNVIIDSGAKPADTYETIKNNIITHFDQSTDQRLRKLLESQNLGDRKASAVLRQLQRLAPGNENLVKLRFLEILPEPVRVTLASLDGISLEKLAETADRMMEQMPKFQNVNHTHGSTSAQSASWLDTVTGQISELTKVVHALTVCEPRDNDRGRSRFRSDTPNRRNRSLSYNPAGRLCWYHFRFGRNARNCRDGCQWATRSSRPSSPTHSGNARSPSPARHPTGK